MPRYAEIYFLLLTRIRVPDSIINLLCTITGNSLTYHVALLFMIVSMYIVGTVGIGLGKLNSA